jgi:hypothetical protein
MASSQLNISGDVHGLAFPEIEADQPVFTLSFPATATSWPIGSMSVISRAPR